MIFIDSNIPMYLTGADHPNRFRARFLIEKLISEKRSLITSAEVFQEIIHRYSSINRVEAITVNFKLLTELCDAIYPIELKDVINAASNLKTHSISSDVCSRTA